MTDQHEPQERDFRPVEYTVQGPPVFLRGTRERYYHPHGIPDEVVATERRFRCCRVCGSLYLRQGPCPAKVARRIADLEREVRELRRGFVSQPGGRPRGGLLPDDPATGAS